MKTKHEVSAGGIVFQTQSDGSRHWLLTQHSLHKGWGFPKGIVGDVVSDEPMEAAALREVGEEGGIIAEIVHPEPVQVGYSYQFEGTLVQKNVYYYLMRYLSGDPKDHDWEVSEAFFADEHTVRKMLSFASDREAFDELVKRKTQLS